MNINNRKKHIVIIKGGIGNQIFIYYFALYLKNKYPNDIVLCETRSYFWLDYKYRAKFKLKNLELKLFKNSVLGSLWMSVIIIFINIFPLNKVNKSLKKIFVVNDKNLKDLQKYYLDKNIFIYNGYFQNYRIIDKAYINNKISINSKLFSIKYKNLENKIKNNNLSVAFCIRNFNMESSERYSYSIEKFNMLIKKILKQEKDAKFYIFAYKNININEYKFPSNAELITHENGYSDDSAILKMIATCNIKVISNSSTFYWIAAYISKKGICVSETNKVYISENYRFAENLFYPSWIKY